MQSGGFDSVEAGVWILVYSAASALADLPLNPTFLRYTSTPSQVSEITFALRNFLGKPLRKKFSEEFFGKGDGHRICLEFGDESFQIAPSQALTESSQHSRKLPCSILQPCNLLRLHLEVLRTILHRHLPYSGRRLSGRGSGYESSFGPTN